MTPLLSAHIYLYMIILTFAQHLRNFALLFSVRPVSKKVVLVDMPYCSKNKEFLKGFMKNFDYSTDNKYDMRMM